MAIRLFSVFWFWAYCHKNILQHELVFMLEDIVIYQSAIVN